MTLEELKQNLVDRGYEDAVVFENPDYASAAIGVSEDGRVIYSFEKMVDCLVEDGDMDYEAAYDFISYNTLRAMPYAGDKAPIVMYDLND